jgi:hypothetical protein
VLCNTHALCINTCSNSKSSECKLKDFFTSKQLTFKYNQCTPGSKKRPDFLFQTAFGSIVVENDEHEHKSTSGAVELERMKEIHAALQHPVHFIRFNPDLTKKHREPLSHRHEVLTAFVSQILEQPQLFFEGHVGLTVTHFYYD